MKVWTRASATAAIVVGLTLSGVGVSTSPASAAPKCSGSSCNGKFPDEAGCTDGVTIESFSRSNSFVELRYSKRCNAAWARGVSNNGKYNCSGWTNQDILTIEASTGRTYSRNLSCGPGSNFFTPMVSFNYNVRACLKRYKAFGATTPNGCTAWR